MKKRMEAGGKKCSAYAGFEPAVPSAWVSDAEQVYYLASSPGPRHQPDSPNRAASDAYDCLQQYLQQKKAHVSRAAGRVGGL